MFWCLAAFFLFIPADAGTCDDISKREIFFKDITGWHCDGIQRSLYCKCSYEYDYDYDWDDSSGGRRRKSGEVEYECDKQMEEYCDLGCKHGKCRTADSVCGTTWSSGPTTKTCAQVFALASEATLLEECEAAFGKYDAICPASVLPYKSWLNKMENGDEVLNMVRAAAMDTLWFYNRLKGMVVPNNGSPVPKELVTTDIDTHFTTFRAFSCHRNIPECKSDKPEVSTCETSCQQVTTSIDFWLNKCRLHENAAKATTSTGAPSDAGASNGSTATNGSTTTTPPPSTSSNGPIYDITCKELGYERDCDGSKAATAGEYPGLCSAFQQQTQHLFMVSGAVPSTGFLHLAAVLGVMAAFL